MYKGKRVLAVVPARGGSKGVKLKNLREIDGKSLIYRAGETIGAVKEIDLAVVSTDHEEIAEQAIKSGLSAPFRRPETLSGDRIGDVEVLTHALLASEERGNTVYDVVLMIQPTSPSRRPDHIWSALAKLIDGGFDSVWTVSETDSKAHPLKQLMFTDDRMDYYDPRGAKIIARQQLKTLYHRNGIAYAITRKCLLNQKSIKGPNASAIIINGPVANIDTEFDLTFAEFLARQGLLPLPS